MYLVEISFLSFNRINLLINRLENLIEKINYFNLNQYICISIFDNNSDEKDIKKLKNFLKSIPQKIDINLFESVYNLGFPGNLEKSIENSNCFYKWLFSDDDYLNLAYLSNIIQVLKEKEIDFLSLKTIAINKPPKGKKTKEDFCNVSKLYNPDINKFLNKKNNIDLDKNLGFISSNIIKLNFLQDSLKEIKLKNNTLLKNNYLIKAINYNVFNRISILGILDSYPIVFQNIEDGSYFYNDPVLRRKTFLFDSTEIYIYIKKLSNMQLSYKSKAFMEQKLYLNFSLWLSLKRDKFLKISDIFYVFKNSQRIYPSIFLIYLLPLCILRKFRVLKNSDIITKIKGK